MNKLAVRETVAAVSHNDFEAMLRQAQILLKSGFLPKAVDTPEKAVAIILTGQELGIGTMQSLRAIDVISGKPTVSPQLMLALINQSGQLENIKIVQDDDGVMCAMKRRNRDAHSEYFGFVEAKKLGLDQKDNYKKQPFTMFRWRAVASCARVVFPDVILGLYTPDEMGADITDEGEIAGVQTEIVPFEPRTTVKMLAPDVPVETAQADHSEEWNKVLPSGDAKPAQLTDENQELIGEIKWLVNDLGKNESDFNAWFQKYYEFDGDWEKAGVAVKRECLAVLKNWKEKNQRQAA